MNCYFDVPFSNILVIYKIPVKIFGIFVRLNI